MGFKLLHDKARNLLDDLESVEIKQLFNVFVESILVDNVEVEIQYNLTDAVGEDMAYVIKEKTRPNVDVCADGGDGGCHLENTISLFSPVFVANRQLFYLYESSKKRII